ncbi:DegT/DnrJ/EryC1/StrS family aminotransferase [Sphingomonas sp.]|uniref:DegT/DnrJ/EryC1/StrS family aminotransferase n=1 Tax=Sphingomonas sp. TaxID=28214 RepID=UPI0017C731CD|nr:DegT/DnrJ/EryC1/StrS family aminotransferase [Sphingomonas sp.]MBA3511525.1 DegT/DnrJ/EryC1/StrS family aminotransferase [Sphingomonas sp.]
MTIKFLDLEAAHEELSSEIDAALRRVVRSGQFIHGPEVESFETAFAAYCEARHCIGVGNGLDALHLILRALEIGPGDEVIVSSNTFIATWLAVTMVGAIPIPVEPDPDTHNIDPRRVANAITSRTKAILPTHLYGQPADLDPLLELAKHHGLRLVEDAAQAHGARYKERRIGGHGDAVAWSFYPGKNLGALGDGGAVTTDDPKIAERVRMLGNYGSRTKYVNPVRGYNSRLDPVHAAVLSVKLRHLDEWNARRVAVAGHYSRQLADSGLGLPVVPDWADPAWHLYVVRAPHRQALVDHLREAGVQTLIHYPIPPHLQAAYADLGLARGSLPIAEQLATEVLSLPIGPHMSAAEVDAVEAAVQAFYADEAAR